MTVADFKARVAAYIARDASSFVVGGVDNLLGAINDARSYAQQSYDFQKLRTYGFVQVGTSGAEFATAYATPSTGGTAVKFKKLDSVWLYGTSSDGSVNRIDRIDFATEQDFKRLLPTYAGYAPWTFYNTLPTQRMFAYVVGSKLFVTTITTPTWYYVGGVQRLSDLTGSESSDFFVDNYSQWLLTATLQNLNLFLKEDQRVQISDAVLQRLWAAMTFDDSNTGAQGEWTSLD